MLFRMEIKKILQNPIKVLGLLGIPMLLMIAVIIFLSQDYIGKETGARADFFHKLQVESEAEGALDIQKVEQLQQEYKDVVAHYLQATLEGADSADPAFSDWVYYNGAIESTKRVIERDRLLRFYEKGSGAEVIASFFHEKLPFRIYDPEQLTGFVKHFWYGWFACIVLTLISATSFSMENGMELVIHATKKRKIGVYDWKQTVILLLTPCVVAGFFFVNLILNCCIFHVGLGELNAPLYMVDGCSGCEGGLTILSLLGLQLLCTILVAFLCSLGTLVLARLFRKSGPVMFTALTVFVIGCAADWLAISIYSGEYDTSQFWLMSKVTFDHFYEQMKLYNPFALLQTLSYCAKVGFVTIANVVIYRYVILVCVTVIADLILYILYSLVDDSLWKHLDMKRNQKPVKMRPFMILELKKYLCGSFLAGIIVLILAWPSYQLVVQKGVQNGDDSSRIVELYQQYSGLMTKERFHEIEAHYEDVQQTLLAEGEMRIAFESGEISAEEYQGYRNHFYVCRNIERAIGILYEDASNKRIGVDWLLYPEFYEKILDPSIWYHGVIWCSLYVVAYSFIMEKRKMKGLLLSTRNGRTRLMRVRLFSAVILTIMAGTVLAMLEALLIITANGSIGQNLLMNAPACTLSIFSGIPAIISIGNMMLFIPLLRIIIASLISAIATGIISKIYFK